MLVGLWRGVIVEVLALLTWAAAFFAAKQGVGPVSALLRSWIVEPPQRQAVALVAIFLLVLLAGMLLRWLVRELVHSVGLGLLDRALGAVFGIVRGVVLLLMLVLCGGATGLPRQAWWRDAWLAPPLETAALSLRSLLPADMAARIHYR